LDKSTPPQRPDLFSAALPGDGSRRILASLENSGKTNTPAARLGRLRPIQLVTLLTLLAVVAAAIAAISYWGLAPAPYSQPLAPAVPQVPLVSAPDEVQRRAAAIVNEPLPAMAPVRQKLATAVQAKAAPPLRAAPAPTTTPASAHPALHTERGEHTRQRHLPRHAQATGPARLSAATQHTDSDVALLAALVAHTDGQPSAIVHMRDVVERRDGDSTDALLRRCERLGGPEAGLCRARICNGQWLYEAACRTPLSD
jgi:hypothetical protein